MADAIFLDECFELLTGESSPVIRDYHLRQAMGSED